MTPPRRQGPRPLAFHLASATNAWLISRAALPQLRSGSLPWRPEFAHQGRALGLALNLAGIKNSDFIAALDVELIVRAEAFLAGLEAYRRHPYRRALKDPPVVWQQGATRLLDYGPSDGVPVLVVPSLINRAYILDLAPGQSLLRYLSTRGLRPLLIDWGAPGDEERRFRLDDFIAHRLESAAAAALEKTGAAPLAMGYCMGGLLALALAARRPECVRALALLATPWHFHAERAEHARLLGALAEPMMRAYQALGEVPVDALQILFAAQDPLLAMRKFSRFAGMEPNSTQAQRFVAVEDWLNDGVPLPLEVARECLGGWYGADLPGRGLWCVAGKKIQAAKIKVPSLVVVPAQDRIVPPRTAAAVAQELPCVDLITPALGHIGMIVARDALKSVWTPLAQWLKTRADEIG